MRRLSFGPCVLALVLFASGCGAASSRAPEPAAAEAPGTYRTQSLGAEVAVASANEGSSFTDDSLESAPRAPPPPPAPPPQPMGYPQQQAKAAEPQGATTPVEKSSPQPGQAEARSKEHLVYTADLTLAVYQVEIGLDRAEEVARSLGGYLASRGDHEIVIRVPRDRFREAMAQVERLGDVVHRDVKAIDVTDEFVDTESRLKNARVMRDRLQALLAKAAVKEAIEIEKELGRVTEQIEVLEGKLKGLSDRIAFSTLTVRYAAKGTGDSRPNFRLPFVWVHSLGVHRLLNFQQSSGQ